MSEPMYPPNSHKYKEEQKAAAAEEKRVTKVVKGPVKTKTNEARKLANVFISEDVSIVKNYIIMDVIVPAIKKALYDVVTNGIDMILYGGTGKGKNNSSSSKVSYRSYYERKDNQSARSVDNNRSKESFNYEDIIFGNRSEAEAAKQQMQDLIGRYGIVTVADLYDMTYLTAPYTAQKYGWMDVSGADIVRVRDGYVIKLPRAVPID